MILLTALIMITVLGMIIALLFTVYDYFYNTPSNNNYGNIIRIVVFSILIVLFTKLAINCYDSYKYYSLPCQIEEEM